MKIISFLLLLVVSTSVMAIPPANAINPIAFVILKKEDEQYNGVCQSLEVKCKSGTVVWKVKNSEDIFYLISKTLELIKVKKVGSKYVKDGQWGLHINNNIEENSDDDLTKGDVYIYPALYPLNKEKQAIALVTKWSEIYSGGGREEEYADFVMLNSDGSYQIAFKHILFSSKEMIKACFTEEEYAKNAHCHDESWSILNIKFIDEYKTYYAWELTTKYFNWPAFTDKASISVKTSKTLLHPFQLHVTSNN